MGKMVPWAIFYLSRLRDGPPCSVLLFIVAFVLAAVGCLSSFCPFWLFPLWLLLCVCVCVCFPFFLFSAAPFWLFHVFVSFLPLFASFRCAVLGLCVSFLAAFGPKAVATTPGEETTAFSVFSNGAGARFGAKEVVLAPCLFTFLSKKWFWHHAC